MWKIIKYNSLELNYEVNEIGEVRNSTSQCILKPKLRQNGYVEYCLYESTNPIYLLAHRIVAEAFIPNPNFYNYVNHIDGNKLNNSVKNLEWCNASQNELHAWANNLNKPHIERQINQYTLNGQYLRTYKSIAEAVRVTGASKIREVANGTRKSSGGFIWTWVEDFIPEDRGRKKMVGQFDLEGNQLAVFESVSEASRQTGANRKGISAVCLGKQKTCSGFYWKFINGDIVQ